jgi:hypothetical protein
MYDVVKLSGKLFYDMPFNFNVDVTFKLQGHCTDRS